MIPFHRLVRTDRRHYAADGYVGCPRQSVDTDIEACLRCRSLREVAPDRSYITCDGAAPERATLLEMVEPASG